MTVNNVNALLNYTAGQTDPSGMKQDELAQDSFNQVMTKVSDAISSLKSDLAGSASNTSAAVRTAEPVSAVKKDTPMQGESQKTVSDKTEDAMQQSGSNNNVKNAESDAETKQAMEEVEKSGEELVRDIAEEMDVTPEEVEQAMEVLGLTAIQLFDVDNLKQLLLTISGSTDELSLVTDETLYGQLQDLTAAVEGSLAELQEELGMSEEELNALVEQMISGNGESEMQDATPAQEADLEGMKDYTVTVRKDGETVQVKVTVDDASGSKSVQEEVTDTPKAEVQTGHKTRERNASADSGRGEGSQTGNAFMQTFDKAMDVNETPEPVDTGYQSVRTEDIMNQIMDYMKINLKAEVQEMELQLHPASLGTVGVQIVAKEGAITAQFTTQNETVRAVIETQLIQLKEQFEEQGIKVDAVEVTVANHEYGQQFSQENENADQKQGKAAKGTRRINLEEIDEDADPMEMEDSERIAVEMMQASGNTVDYTA
ncbi:MAG: hypothetical protein HDR28_04610 [Lachnospiraceae bacterium]|nr:hypothetical protein [Lachnospiraceae bacterium]